jgi:hypothetical protein
LPIVPEYPNKTAFPGPDGEIYVWNRAPMGLVNSPAAFQWLMAHVIQGVPHVNVYIDDITIYTRTWAEHLFTIKIVFLKLREAGLKVKFQMRLGCGRMQGAWLCCQ